MKKKFLTLIYLFFGFKSFVHFFAIEHFNKGKASRVFELGCGNGNVALALLMSGAKSYIGFDTRHELKKTLIWIILSLFRNVEFVEYQFFKDVKADFEIANDEFDSFFVSTGLIQALPLDIQVEFIRLASEFGSGLIVYPNLLENCGSADSLVGVSGCLEYKVDESVIHKFLPLARIEKALDMVFVCW